MEILLEEIIEEILSTIAEKCNTDHKSLHAMFETSITTSITASTPIAAEHEPVERIAIIGSACRTTEELNKMSKERYKNMIDRIFEEIKSRGD